MLLTTFDYIFNKFIFFHNVIINQATALNKERNMKQHILASLTAAIVLLSTNALADDITLSGSTNYSVKDGDVLIGETSGTVTIADGATVTLSNATVNGGVICEGSATIILVDENIVTGASQKAGIQIGSSGTTLTISGDGSLTATGGESGAGIGTGMCMDSDPELAKIGNIIIKGGVVKAIGGKDADGIGTGYTDPDCTREIGSITIYDAVDMVDASSVGKDIIYMHDNTDVSESKKDYFNIIENGERKIIYIGIPAFDVEAQTYTGEAITPKPTVSLGSLNFTEGVDYEYSYTNNVNVGSSATVTVTFKGDYAEFDPVSKSFNITKATPTVIPPTSANPKYTGTCVALVTAGSTNFGTMLYSLDDDDYSENIPCADKGGDYTVYYEVEESDNWSGAAGSVEIQVPVRVDVTVVGDGSVSGYNPDEFYPVGTVLTLTAEPDEDYRFTGWDDDFDAPAERVWTVLADAKDNELTVNFRQKTVCYGAVCVYNDGINEVEATIDGDSDIPWSIPKEIRVQRVNLNRNFARQGYSTIVLPFYFEEIEVDEAEFYELDGVSFANDSWNVSVTPVSEIRPNTPYLIHVMKNNVSFSGDIALRPIDDDVDCSVTKNGWELRGTYEYKVWKDGNSELGRVYGFAAEERDGASIGQFVRLAYNASAKPFRAYLYYAGGNSGESRSMAPALFKAAPAVASIDELPESLDVVIRGEEGTTVIGTINTRTGEFRSAENRWFDLNGRFLGNKKPTIKGTYYNNGKKVIVK